MGQQVNPILWDIIITGKIPGAHHLRNESIFAHSVSPDVGLFLKKMVQSVQAEVALEVGLAFGVSALFICDGLKKSDHTRFIAIDPAQNLTSAPWTGLGLNNLKLAGFEKILTFCEQQSQLALPEMDSNNVRIDFAFIDGMHTFDYALIDFFYIDRMLKVGGIIVFDDVSFPSIQRVCSFVAKNRSYSLVEEYRSFGFLRCLAFKKEADDNRDSDFHRDF